jgi:hypothetical protein
MQRSETSFVRLTFHREASSLGSNSSSKMENLLFDTFQFTFDTRWYTLIYRNQGCSYIVDMRKQKQMKECKLVSMGPQKGHPTADLDH